MSADLPVGPLSLNQLTRDYWGSYDAVTIAQLARAAVNPCYRQKFYKAPGDNQEVLGPGGFVSYGLKITPGSIIYGFYYNLFTLALGRWTVQITDVSLGNKFWDNPISSDFLLNLKPTLQSDSADYSIPTAPITPYASFPNLLSAPYPVVGQGLFQVEIQEIQNTTQRVQLVLGVLEVCNVG